jgi:hypothetical protein
MKQKYRFCGNPVVKLGWRQKQVARQSLVA